MTHICVCILYVSCKPSYLHRWKIEGFEGYLSRWKFVHSVVVHPQLHQNGQSEPAATNAPVGRSVHWMGCSFSFGARWGSSQSISFCCWPLCLFFSFFFGSWPFFPWTWPATLLTFLPPKYCTNLGTLFIFPYWHSFTNN